MHQFLALLLLVVVTAGVSILELIINKCRAQGHYIRDSTGILLFWVENQFFKGMFLSPLIENFVSIF